MADVTQASATASTTVTSTSYSLIAGMSITPGVAGNYLIWFSSTFYTSSDTDVFAAVYVGGVLQANSERFFWQEGSIPNAHMAIGTCWYVTGVGVTDSIEIRAKSPSGTINILERTMIIRKVTAADVAHNSHLAEQSFSSETVLTNCTLTPGSGDWVAWFTASCRGDTSTQTYQTRMFKAGVAQAHTLRKYFIESSIANAEAFYVSQMKIANLGASEVVEVKGLPSSGNMICCGKALTMHKLDEGLVDEVNNATEINTSSTSYVAMTGMTITPGAGDYLVFFSAQFRKTQSGVTNTIQFAIHKDSTIEAHTERDITVEESLDAGNNYPGGTIAYLPSVGAGVAINIRWKISGETAYCTEKTLTVVKIETTQTLLPSGIASLEAFGAASVCREINGITKNNAGAVLGSCHTFLCRDNGDNTCDYIAYVLSNASTGAYSFIAPHDKDYFVLAWKDDSPHVFDVTDHVL